VGPRIVKAGEGTTVGARGWGSEEKAEEVAGCGSL